MKGLAESSPFRLLTNPHVINRFIFGQGVVIYYVFQQFGQVLHHGKTREKSLNLQILFLHIS